MQQIIRFSVVAAPLCFLAYGVLRLIGRMDGQYGTGLDWHAAHVANLAGLVLFFFVVLGIRRLLAPGWLRESVVALTLVGAVAVFVQFVVDIVVGLMAADKAEMSALFADFKDIPGVNPVVYTVVPNLFYLGLVVLLALAAVARRLPWWSPVVLLVGSLLPLATLNLIPVSALLMLVALLPLRSKVAA